MRKEIEKTFPRTKEGILAAYKYAHGFDDDWAWYNLEAYIGKEGVIDAIQTNTDLEYSELKNKSLDELFEIVEENEIENCYRTNEELSGMLVDSWDLDDRDEVMPEYYNYVIKNIGDVFEEDYIARIA